MENAQLIPVDSTPVTETVVPTHVAKIVPLLHHKQFYDSTTPEDKQRVGLLLNFFAEMESAPEGVVAASHRIALTHAIAGFSAKNLQRLYYAFRHSGRDWRILVHKYKGPSALPREFIEFVRMRVEQNTRGARQALLDIRAEWASGQSIPGYGTWREYFLTEFPELDVPERYPFGFLPRGWSTSNLYTKQSSKAERVYKRRGLAAAKRYLHSMIRDRSKLRPMELITIDDFESDQVVQARHPETGRYELCTCTGLVAIDVATGRKLAFGLKPRFKSEEGKRIAITRADVQGLLYSIFIEHGLPQDYGVTILCENAAAAISSDFELSLELLLGVQVARTGLIENKTLRNGFVERGGKPWEKGWVESTFHLMANMAGSLPGQKGASYQLKPADLEAKLLYSEKLLATEGLTPEQLAQLHVPFMKFADALTAYENIFARMEQRTKHHMQGFLEVVDYRLPGRPGIVSESQLMALALSREEVLACIPEPRMESPRERWDRLCLGLTFQRVPQHVLACLLLTPKQVQLKNHKITFAHLSEGYTFADADSPVLSLPEGTELLGYFDPSRPDRLHCTHLNGMPCGSVKRRGAIDIRDRAAINAEAGEITRLITKHVLNPVRARHAAEDAQLAAHNDENRAMLKSWGVPEKSLPPSAEPSAPTRHETQITPAGAKHALMPGRRPVASLSAKLGRHAPARDAFNVYREQLAAGIASEEAERQGRAQRAAEAADQAGDTSLDDLTLAKAGPDPAQTLSPPVETTTGLEDLLN